MSAPGTPRLSALVIVKNEEVVLSDCLRGLAFADEVVVVDSGSTDGTIRVAESHGARVLHHTFETHARQKNWGISQLAHDWVLVVDADERVPTTLAQEIAHVLREGPPAVGYWIGRSNTFLGREIRSAGWDRDRVLRLFDRRHGAYADRRVHEEVELDAPAGRLQHRLEHHPCRDLGTWVTKSSHYARLGAEEAAARGERTSLFQILVRPSLRFVKQYILQGGFRDGREGFLLCTISAHSVFLKYAHLWLRSPR